MIPVVTPQYKQQSVPYVVFGTLPVDRTQSHKYHILYLHTPKIVQHFRGCISSQQQLAATRLAAVHALDKVS